eukprot:CAMPEP_0184697700 /NCGR_PEP_ID=MMETSP0313-20130426/4581_1 /TAXON_ID=2792 /ORGANISM="Porphyridium aerugineum, Strain SAG 1380-2" /LENGTH=672 /DNA_ID=CAMNT_0027156533 /DNA_START=333 /DNA_END=2351 /DNA_ORIENTATION=-
MNPLSTAAQSRQDETNNSGELERNSAAQANGNALPSTLDMVSWNWQTLPPISTLMEPTMQWYSPTTSALIPPTRMGGGMHNVGERPSWVMSPSIPIGLLEPMWMPGIGIKQSSYQAPLPFPFPSPSPPPPPHGKPLEPPYLRVRSWEEEEYLNVMRSRVEEERAFEDAEKRRWQNSMKHAKELIDKDANRNKESGIMGNAASPVGLEVSKAAGRGLPVDSVPLGGTVRWKATNILPTSIPSPSPQASAPARSSKKFATKESVDLPAVTIPLDAHDIENDLCAIKGRNPPLKEAKLAHSAQTALPAPTIAERVNIPLVRPQLSKPGTGTSLKKRKAGRPRVSFPTSSIAPKNEVVDPQANVGLTPRDAKVTAVESIKLMADLKPNSRTVCAKEAIKLLLKPKAKGRFSLAESTNQEKDSSTEVERLKEDLQPMKKKENEFMSLNSKTMSESDETESDTDELEEWGVRPKRRKRAVRGKSLAGKAAVNAQGHKKSTTEPASNALVADRDIELLRPTRFRLARIPVDENLEEAKRKIAQFLYFDVSQSLKGRLICSLCGYVTWPPNSRYHIVSCPEIQCALKTHSLQELKDLEAAKKDAIWQTEREMIVPSKVPGFILAHEPKGYAVCIRCKAKIWAPNAMRHLETAHPDVNPAGLEDCENDGDDGQGGRERMHC